MWHMYVNFRFRQRRLSGGSYCWKNIFIFGNLSSSRAEMIFSVILSSIYCSVQFSRSVMSNCLLPHELQHARPPCPSATPRAYPNSCSLSQWCHPAISSSVVPFSSCPQSLPASESFLMSQLFAWGGQSTGDPQKRVLCLAQGFLRGWTAFANGF